MSTEQQHNQLITTDKLSLYRRTPHIIPNDIIQHKSLNTMIHNSLPSNYNFEIYKTIWRILLTNSKTVCLQMPEGLLMYSCIISDILTYYTQCQCIIMADVVYGACCVDDITAKQLDCDLLVHYGHSCLISNSDTTVDTLYVFVTIDIDTKHLIDTIKHNFPINDNDKLYDTYDNKQQTHNNKFNVILGGTIQFTHTLQHILPILQSYYGKNNVHMTHTQPLSKGETLGCTSSNIDLSHIDTYNTTTIVIFVADGRFHLESLMIQNPHIKQFFRYNPYDKKLTIEQYTHNDMYKLRQDAIELARKRISQYNDNNNNDKQQQCTIGIILGTLGRQGSTYILDNIQQLCIQHNIQHITLLLSEITVDKLQTMPDISIWIQIACPRLSIDWGHMFNAPLLTSYEAYVLFNQTQWNQTYPMDYYSKTGGQWANYAHKRNTKSKPTQPSIILEYQNDTVEVVS